MSDLTFAFIAYLNSRGIDHQSLTVEEYNARGEDFYAGHSVAVRRDMRDNFEKCLLGSPFLTEDADGNRTPFNLTKDSGGNYQDTTVDRYFYLWECALASTTSTKGKE